MEFKQVNPSDVLVPTDLVRGYDETSVEQSQDEGDDHGELTSSSHLVLSSGREPIFSFLFLSWYGEGVVNVFKEFDLSSSTSTSGTRLRGNRKDSVFAVKERKVE